MLNKLSNKVLMANTKDLAAKERLVGAELIAHFAEVDDRRLYADEGFPSMFAFLVEGLKYSEPAAVRRISAARLSKKFPQVLCLLENGDLHLTGLHLLSTHLNEENGNRLIKACLGKSKKTIEEIIVRETGMARVIKETVKFIPAVVKQSPTVDGGAEVDAPKAPAQASASGFSFGTVERTVVHTVEEPSPDVHISLTLDKTSYEKLKRAQTLAGAESMADIVKKALDVYLEHKDPAVKLAKKPKAPKTKHTDVDDTKKAPSPATVTVERHDDAIPVAEKRAVVQRDGWRCSFKNPETGERCCETGRLEFDHILARALGGSNHSSNLRLLCRSHNLLMARMVFGAEFMERKMKGAHC